MQTNHKLIQDVYLPRERPNRSVLHTAIGVLADRWERRKRTRHQEASLDTLAMSSDFTRVRPLSQSTALRGGLGSLALYVRFAYLRVSLLLARVFKALSQVVQLAYARASQTIKRLPQLTFGDLEVAWLPKKYDYEHGVHPDWQQPTFVWAKRFGAPLIALLLIGLVTVWAWPLAKELTGHGGHRAHTSTGSTSATSQAVNHPSSSKAPGSTSSPAAASTGLTTSPYYAAGLAPASNGSGSTLTPSLLATPSSTPAVSPPSGGGLGAGPLPVTNPTPPPIPLTTTTCTQLAGKTLPITSSTCVSAN